MKSAKERQRDYRERRKEQREAGLIKLKVLTRASAGKKLEMLSEIDGTDIGTVLHQAVELLWTQRFGKAGAVEQKVIAPEPIVAPKKGKKKKADKETQKETKLDNVKAKSRTKAAKDKAETAPIATL